MEIKQYFIDILNKFGIYQEFKENFNESGVFITGGAVRDFYLGKIPDDLDFVLLNSKYSTENLDKFSKSLRKTLIELGKEALTTYRIVINNKGVIDFTFTNNVDDDIIRRDFSINSIFFDFNENCIIDKVSGINDIENKILDVISINSIKNDPVRILRGYRFSCLGFSISEKSRKYFIEFKSKISKCPFERITYEFIKILRSSTSCKILKSMMADGVLNELFPIFSVMNDCSQNKFHHLNVFEHSLKIVEYIEMFSNELMCKEILSFLDSKQLCEKMIETVSAIIPNVKSLWILKLSALFHDSGKPSSKIFNKKKNDYSFYNHERKSLEIFIQYSKKFKLSNRITEFVSLIVKNHMNASIFSNQKSGKKAYFRLLKRIGTDRIYDFLLFSISDRISAFGPKTTNEEVITFLNGINKMLQYIEQMSKKIKKPLIRGRDLLENFKIKPGIIFNKILSDVEEKYNACELSEKNQALNYIQKKFKLDLKKK